MIAFSRESTDEDAPPFRVLFIGPQAIARRIESSSFPHDMSMVDEELNTADVARQQQELAMLQRALVHCRLIDKKD